MYRRRIGPTPDAGYGLNSAAQPGPSQVSMTLVTGPGGADLGYGHVCPACGYRSSVEDVAGSIVGDDGPVSWPGAVSSSGRRPGNGRVRTRTTWDTSPDARRRFLARPTVTHVGGFEEPLWSGNVLHDLSLAEEWADDAESRRNRLLPEIADARENARQVPTPDNKYVLAQLEVAGRQLEAEASHARSISSGLLAQWQGTEDAAFGRNAASRTDSLGFGGVFQRLADEEQRVLAPWDDDLPPTVAQMAHRAERNR